jgi:hypothetical protein
MLYFKMYKSQLQVIELALDTAALMLGTDKSRGYCLEMICADFLAGAIFEGGSPDAFLRRPRLFFPDGCRGSRISGICNYFLKSASSPVSSHSIDLPNSWLSFSLLFAPISISRHAAISK